MFFKKNLINKCYEIIIISIVKNLMRRVKPFVSMEMLLSLEARNAHTHACT